ncbi:MAG: hypothetical protein IKG15_00840 [Solobacterium sp.]|nr:hypothetical protein [Solobacterium sp.]
MNGYYITITHINDFYGFDHYRCGMPLRLKKDHDNPYDDEAITVLESGGAKCGYVANSTGTVCRGTHSAGYISHLFEEETDCTVRFICDDFLIAELHADKS